MTGPLPVIPRHALLNYLQHVVRCYFSVSRATCFDVASGPAPVAQIDPSALGRAWALVELPSWAADLGVAGRLLVDRAALTPGEGPPHERCDWWLAAFSHLSGIAEVHWERRHGPVHSFRFRLPHLDDALFDHAWANRILLLIRRLSARSVGRTEEEMFGPLPKPIFELTHDIDALRKTGAIRLKQSLFELFNALRGAAQAKFKRAAHDSWRAARFAAITPRYNWLEETADLASAAGLRSLFHIYSRTHLGLRNPRTWLFDPSYRIDDPALITFVAKASEAGCEFGLHPSFDSWNDTSRIAAERSLLAGRLARPVQRCRQHWLRFSWRYTWPAQAAAGLKIDSTLGFNDRPGFRAGVALKYRPWDFAHARPHDIEVVPLILMDAHLFAYLPTAPRERCAAMWKLCNEVRAVAGCAAVLWHPHTLANDYGWRPGYKELLAAITGGFNA